MYKTSVWFVLLFALTSFQDKQEIGEPTIKAFFVYNFTKYIEWPSEKDAVHIIIGFYGPSGVKEELKKICADKKVKNRGIEIKGANDVSEAEKCDIFFIPQSESDDFKYLYQALLGKGVLIVTEQEGMAQKGASINIVEKDSKIRFEINEYSIKSAGLKISSQLMSLAIVVNADKP